jgi:hypothetical protein
MKSILSLAMLALVASLAYSPTRADACPPTQQFQTQVQVIPPAVIVQEEMLIQPPAVTYSIPSASYSLETRTVERVKVRRHARRHRCH